MLEQDARFIVNSKSAITRKAWTLAPIRNKGSVNTISHGHFWLVCYKGKFDPTHKKPFGFMDKTAGLKSSVLMENPSIPPMYRLADEQGTALNLYEKHMGEIVEQLARFVDRADTVLDFCSGTCSAGLAALYKPAPYCPHRQRSTSDALRRSPHACLSVGNDAVSAVASR